jgi:xanthine dehydrogenase iron-sulfur cluster and FAD-binding subunit A
MKPARFDYQAPGTFREAIDLLASNPEAMGIAGGQSLMPVLAFRLATPSLLVDLRRLPGLGNIAVGDDGFRLGALVRWRDIEDDQRLVAAHPLLHAAVAHVAHYQIRNRGTVGGSLAHADRSEGPASAAWPFRQIPLGDDLVRPAERRQRPREKIAGACGARSSRTAEGDFAVTSYGDTGQFVMTAS